jgi:alpha-L-fucosidase
LEVGEGAVVNTLFIAGDIERGQRVERFAVEAFVNGKWRHIAEGTTIGYKRLLRFSDCRAERIRITINECRTTANIADVSLYYAEPLHYEGQRIRTSDVATDGWQTVGVDACAAIDGDTATAWRSDALTPLTIDMGITHNIAGLCYAPATDDAAGTIFIYNAYLSEDGNEWVQCVEAGEFSNIKNNPVPYYVNFGQSYPARYLRIEPLREIDDRNATSVGEIGVLLPR